MKTERNFRFAIVSDLHIALPHTIWDHPSRFHLVEISIPALEKVFAHLTQLNLDFLLIPGDLTQHGEADNHQWLQNRLQSLPFPVYVIPGNHDVPSLAATKQSIAWADFPEFYRPFGYENIHNLYYSCELQPGLHLIALNSNQFDEQGNQIGMLDSQQLIWLEETLETLQDQYILVMIHHNVIEHLPGQLNHELGKRYMLANAPILRKILQKFAIKFIFTGHLHVQDVVENEGIYEITTGSLVSYPHPYRLLNLQLDQDKKGILTIESHLVHSLPGWDNLTHISKEWMADRSYPFMMRLLSGCPLYLPLEEAEKYAPQLRYFWANIAAGDTLLEFPDFPLKLQNYFQKFGAIHADGFLNFIDNHVTLFING
jgi:3',5'-cyclic AMP phosphodiesterase CpdA